MTLERRQQSAEDRWVALARRYRCCEDFPPKTVLIGAIAAAEG